MWYVDDNGTVRAWANTRSDDFRSTAEAALTQRVGAWYWTAAEILPPEGGSLAIDHETAEVIRKDDQGAEVSRVQMEQVG